MPIVHAESSTVQDIKQILENQGIDSKTVRILSRIGWGGVSFNLALDEPAHNDKIEEIEGLKFLVDNNLYDMYKNFTIEAVKQGTQTLFKIVPG